MLIYCFLVKIIAPKAYNNVLGCKKVFQTLPFYNTFIENPEIKKLSSIQLLQGLPLYDELSVSKRNQVHLVDMQEVIKLK